MGKWGKFLAFFGFITILGAYGIAKAEDVVYLKDGSIIHGMIIEEVPGVSIKIQTNDGNVFVYKVKDVEKITHSAENTGTGNSPAVLPKALVRDPNARFNKFGLFFSGGFWAPGGTQQFNNDLESASGSDDYDYLPGWFKFGLGFGWYTNNFALKWDFQGTIQPNDYFLDDETIDTYILYGGMELEGDVGIDMITNKDNVFTVYLPFIVGVWGEEYSASGTVASDTYDGVCTDFGTGVGIRGFDTSNFLWDFQMVYRFSDGGYLKDANGSEIPYVDGKYIYADVAGLDLNFQLGLLFQ